MAKKRPSQEDKVYGYLLEHKTITQAIAYEVFKISRLSARIYNLKNLGIAIGSQKIYYIKEDGSPGQYSEYWLENRDELRTN
jgi:hypothetical protein